MNKLFCWYMYMYNYLYNFFDIYEVLKRFVCHNFKVEIRDVYIFAIFFNYCSMVKKKLNWVIDVLLQCHLRLHMLYNYKYNIHKTFLSLWRNGKFVTVKTFWFKITTTNINQIHEVEYSTFNGAQSHSWC